jgi:hypothetical protein
MDKTSGRTQRGIFRIGVRVVAYILVVVAIDSLEGVSARLLHPPRGLAMPCKSDKEESCTPSGSMPSNARACRGCESRTKSLLGLRGGDSLVIPAFRQVSEAIAESTTNSWIALIAVILNGSLAATLSKMASEKSDSIYLATSLLLYNIRYARSFVGLVGSQC